MKDIKPWVLWVRKNNKSPWEVWNSYTSHGAASKCKKNYERTLGYSFTIRRKREGPPDDKDD